ncbi:MAG TPA: phosphoadenylyl-sulfate reductase [Burkholderiales bacterium]|jgi:phosphoadenosine phosphosulfate reductase|nr:phosphoadenylyl-sulfate reductase [Burkholderiales bacterium]
MTARIPAPAPSTRPAWSELALRLARIAAEFPRAAFASSLGAEDMVLTDAIWTANLPITVFTLDTGRLPGQTLDLVRRAQEHYGRPIEIFRPDDQAVAAYVAAHGLNAFYESVELRKACCHVRKVEPLERALAGREAWITGLRRSQSVTRADLPQREFDAVHGMVKFNPLADWSEDDVWAWIRSRGVPYNALHDRGYPSIGCDPCTRAIRPGEDVRAGRWWWEQRDSRECGIHVSPLAGPGGEDAPNEEKTT